MFVVVQVATEGERLRARVVEGDGNIDEIAFNVAAGESNVAIGGGAGLGDGVCLMEGPRECGLTEVSGAARGCFRDEFECLSELVD